MSIPDTYRKAAFLFPKQAWRGGTVQQETKVNSPQQVPSTCPESQDTSVVPRAKSQEDWKEMRLGGGQLRPACGPAHSRTRSLGG